MIRIEQPIHTIENDRLLKFFPMNVIVVAFFTILLGDILFHYIVWVILFIALFIMDHILFSNTWEFYKDRIEVKFKFGKNRKIFGMDEIEFKCVQGRGDTPVELKRLNEKNRIISFKSYFTSNLSNSDFIFIYKYCDKRKIRMIGPWEKIISDL